MVPLPRQPTRDRPGGHDQAVVRDLVAVGERDDPPVEIEPGGGDTAPPRDVEAVHHIGLAEQDPFGLPLTGEQPLRQRRAVVRQVGLVTDQRDVTVETAVPERLDGPQARERGAHDDDVADHGSMESTSAP